jgi:demethylspheroidene O-methyltransferase
MAALSAGLSRATVVERMRDWRSRIIADERFQRWAANSPITRRVAQRKARALFDLCAGFVYSQVLSACVKLEVFELLRPGAKDCEALAPRMALSVPAARRLLKAAASLGLLRALPNDRFALDDLGAAMIGNPAIAAFVAHHDLLYSDLRDPVALLRGEHETALSGFWPYAVNRPGAADNDAAPKDVERCDAYSELMTRTQALVSETVLDAYRFDRHRRLMDVGGGEGAFLAAAAKRVPNLELALFDLPAVATRARERLGSLGIGGRVETFAGDMLRDRLPRGADVISLVRVLHDHDDESARTLIAAIRDALPRGGSIVVAEPMAGAPGAEPMGDAYFGFYLLAMGRGRPRTMGEIAQLLKAEGFEAERAAKTGNPMVVSVFVARRV